MLAKGLLFEQFGKGLLGDAAYQISVQVKKLDRIVLIQTRIPGYVLYKYKQIAYI